jgi:hypothetical protein
MDVERALRLMRFEMVCELGKARLGLGIAGWQREEARRTRTSRKAR